MKNPFVEEKEEKEEKMIGGYVPIDMANYLRLSSIYQGRSLQNLLIEILNSWRVTQGKLPSTMIEHLAQKAFGEWEKWEWVGKKTQTEYLKEIENHLSSLKMPEDYTAQILERTDVMLSKGSIAI